MCCYIQFFLDIFKYIEFPLKKFIIHDIQTSSFCDVVFFFKIQFFLDNFYLLNLISMGKKSDSLYCLTFGFTMQNILRGDKVRFESSFFLENWRNLLE